MSKPTFYIGLCMAGAVSAGAYTAGVMDYLIEALDNWESQRGQGGIPDHIVKIPVIGGASAGGMTGILTASAINNPIPPVRKVDQQNLFQKFSDNKFWHTWVDLCHDDMFPLLLDTKDIKKANIVSLFNASFIDEIAARITSVDTQQWIQRPYIEDNLKLFTTLTSFKGLSFDIGFLGTGTDPDRYCVTRHNDYACFRLNSTEYQKDGWIPLDFRTKTGLAIATDAAMATGAFPVGLKSRRVVRDSAFLNDHPFLKKITSINPIPAGLYDSLNADGGIIDNEPFDRVREILTSITGQTPVEYNDYNTFTSTVLMIDPFPSEPPEYRNSDKLFHVMGSTLSALLNQVRIKPENLVAAATNRLAGQYLIAPSRDVPQIGGKTKEEMGSRAIACGALAGFSGFLHKEFRIHDFFLGRANCEKFLRDHFTVPGLATNIITDGYKNLTEEQKQRFYSRTNKDHLPIIPVLSPRTSDKYMPIFESGTDWPIRVDDDIERFRSKTRTRVNELIMNLDDYNVITWILLRIGGFVLLNGKIAGQAIDTIKGSLREHQLLR